MRHRVFGKKLGRKTAPRQALFKSLARSFFLSNGSIKTTLAKAKAVQPFIEKIITKAGKAELVDRRWIYSLFQNQKFVNNIVEKFGKKFKKLKGGYTKIEKIRRRKGDNALIVNLKAVKEIK